VLGSCSSWWGAGSCDDEKKKENTACGDQDGAVGKLVVTVAVLLTLGVRPLARMMAFYAALLKLVDVQ
jgi:hypothetical protein